MTQEMPQADAVKDAGDAAGDILGGDDDSQKDENDDSSR